MLQCQAVVTTTSASVTSTDNKMAATGQKAREGGDVITKPRVLTLEDCQIAVKEYTGRGDFTVDDWKEKTLDGDTPLGFLGGHIRLRVTVRWEGGALEEIPFFVKTPPSGEGRSDFVEGVGAMKKEELYYTELEPAMRVSLASAGGAAGTTRRPWGCRCALARAGLLVLEDLGALGFRSYGSRDLLDRAHASLVARSLAALHAASLAFEETRDKQLGKFFRCHEQFPEAFEEAFYVREEGHLGRRFTFGGVQAISQVAQLLPLCQRDPAARLRVAEKMPEVLWRVCDVVKPSTRHRNVIAHGDLWLNNVLFRYDESTGQPVDARFVDYQLLRYVPPAYEVFQYLYVSCSHAFRVEHTESLLREYYTYLDEQLRALGFKAQQLLPLKAFEASWEDSRLHGLLIAPFFLHYILVDEAVIGEMLKDPERFARVQFEGRPEMIVEQFRVDKEYRERLSETVEEIVRDLVLVDDAKKKKAT